jgi:hypothetical protein
MDQLQFAIAILQAVPGIVAAGMDVVQFVQAQMAALTAMQAAGRDPSADEWAALRAQVDNATDQLAQVSRPLA